MTLLSLNYRFESVPDMKYYLRYFAHAIEIIGNQRCSDSDTNIYALMLWRKCDLVCIVCN